MERCYIWRKKIKTPEFRNLEEEAAWWDANQTTVESLLTTAAVEGKLQRGTLAKKGSTPTTTIRLAADDIELAKKQAAERGLRYQTLSKDGDPSSVAARDCSQIEAQDGGFVPAWRRRAVRNILRHAPSIRGADEESVGSEHPANLYLGAKVGPVDGRRNRGSLLAAGRGGHGLDCRGCNFCG
jgi:predicted DNA binding CopG/RHH family protein